MHKLMRLIGVGLVIWGSYSIGRRGFIGTINILDKKINDIEDKIKEYMSKPDEK